MLLSVRVAFVLYLLVLTVLLLLPDPHGETGIGPLPPPMNDYVTHFVLLAGLTVLAHAGRWPLGTRVLVALLAAYAVAMEALQVLAPPRDVELGDFVENLLGVALGTAAWWAMQKMKGLRRRA